MVNAGVSVATVSSSENEGDPEENNEDDPEEDNEDGPEEDNEESEVDGNKNYEVESEQKEPIIIMHGKTFKNIYPIKSESDILTDDWFLVSFVTNSKKPSSSKIDYKYYVGQVIRKKNKTYEGTFLRSKRTRDDNGFIYCFPDVKDEYEFQYEQVDGRLDKPTVYKRGLLKFQLDFNSF